MKELSLNILDIAQNSLTARASRIRILLEETEQTLRITIEDNGCGMDADMVAHVTDPFCTTRKTRKVGLGIPLFKLAAEQTGGSLSLVSTPETEDAQNHGTVISALFCKDSIDFTPLGDIVTTVCTLVQSMMETDLFFEHILPAGKITLDTASLRNVLGDVPLSTPDVLIWIRDYLGEQYDSLQ